MSSSSIDNPGDFSSDLLTLLFLPEDRGVSLMLIKEAKLVLLMNSRILAPA
jgi:hypothetical protein